MINRAKIADGDSIIIALGEDATSAFMQKVRDNIKDWLGKRGLHNCEIMIMARGDKGSFSINILSVNDVFEDAVLNEGRKQEA